VGWFITVKPGET